MSSSEVHGRINATVSPLATQLETLIQSVRKLSERSSIEEIEASERFGQNSENQYSLCLALEKNNLTASLKQQEKNAKLMLRG